MSYFDGVFIPSVFVCIRHARKNDTENLKKAVSKCRDNLKFLSKHIKLAERQLKYKTTQIYLFGEKVGLFDFYVLPFLQNMETLFDKAFQTSLFKVEKSDESSDDLIALKNYYEFARKHPSFLYANINVKELPKSNNTLLKELNMLDRQNYNYENYVYQYYNRKFLNSMPVPKL